MSTPNVGDFTYSDVVSFPFGYGLSYTDFSYSDMTIDEDEKNYYVTVTVHNDGDTYSGKEVVQVYLQKPYSQYDKENGIEKASVELVGFGKTGVIPAGQSEEITVSVAKEDFKSYDSNGAGTYILSSGDYYLSVGKNSHDALNNILAAKDYDVSDGMDEQGDSSLASLVLNQEEEDLTTYSVSSETNNPITNKLDFMDMNRYENAGDNEVTYLSRSNWTGTWPDEPISFSVSGEAMAYDLSSNKPLDETDETMPQYGIASGLQLATLRSTEETPISYDDPLWDTLLDQMTYGEQAELITSGGFSTIIVPSVGKPATKDDDGATGIVNSKTQSVLPSKGIIASTYNKELIQKIGDALAEDIRYAGCQGFYAPGINLHRTPFGGRANEYYSEDPYLTGAACVAEITGLQNKGVIPTIKHYAFNNEETNRNGIGIWMNEQEARELMLKPFEMALRPSMGNGHAIMTSFNRAGCIWTSASDNLMVDINRSEWGFDGYSLTDMAASNAAAYMVYSDGINNGTDLYLGTGSQSALDEFRNNAKFCNRMRDSCHRILYVICNFSAAMNGVSPTGRVVFLTPWWRTLLHSIIGISAILTGAGVVMLVLCYIPQRKEN